MTVDEYRRKHPSCNYCVHRVPAFFTCLATDKDIKAKTAKSCPCYQAKEWEYKTDTRVKIAAIEEFEKQLIKNLEQEKDYYRLTNDDTIIGILTRLQHKVSFIAHKLMEN